MKEILDKLKKMYGKNLPEILLMCLFICAVLALNIPRIAEDTATVFGRSADTAADEREAAGETADSEAIIGADEEDGDAASTDGNAADGGSGTDGNSADGENDGSGNGTGSRNGAGASGSGSSTVTVSSGNVRVTGDGQSDSQPGENMEGRSSPGAQKSATEQLLAGGLNGLQNYNELQTCPLIYPPENYNLIQREEALEALFGEEGNGAAEFSDDGESAQDGSEGLTDDAESAQDGSEESAGDGENTQSGTEGLADDTESAQDDSAEQEDNLTEYQDAQPEIPIDPEENPARTLTLLGKMLRNRIEEYDGDWSVYVCNLSTQESIVVNDQPMKSASVMKLFIMGAVYRAIEAGELERTDEIMFLMDSMITASDNESSNQLLYILGDSSYEDGIAVVDDFIREYGFSEMTVEYNGFNNSATVTDSSNFNQVSAKDCGKLLEDIYRRKWVNRAVSNEIENMLLNQHTRYKIPAGLPDGVLCGNKSGEMDTTENDAAIIYAQDCDYILVVLSSDWNSKDEAISRIATISGMVYEFLN